MLGISLNAVGGCFQDLKMTDWSFVDSGPKSFFCPARLYDNDLVGNELGLDDKVSRFRDKPSHPDASRVGRRLQLKMVPGFGFAGVGSMASQNRLRFVKSAIVKTVPSNGQEYLGIGGRVSHLVFDNWMLDFEKH